MEIQRDIRDEVLRYLGYRGQKKDDAIDNIVDDIIGEIKLLIEARYIYKEFKIKNSKDGLYLEKTNLYLPGEDIKKHLKGSKKCILMAASLGNAVDTRIRYYEKVDMAKALILDAATAFIEDLCDRLVEEIESNLIEKNKKLTSRYSPGYGDLPIDIQNEFLKTLDSQRSIGLTLSSSSILIPRKSVTAILGIRDRNIIKEDKNCRYCKAYKRCNFKRGGKGFDY